MVLVLSQEWVGHRMSRDWGSSTGREVIHLFFGLVWSVHVSMEWLELWGRADCWQDDEVVVGVGCWCGSWVSRIQGMVDVQLVGRTLTHS